MKTKIFSKFVLSAAVVLCAGALMVGTADAKKKWGAASASNTTVALGVGVGSQYLAGGGGFGVGISHSTFRRRSHEAAPALTRILAVTSFPAARRHLRLQRRWRRLCSWREPFQRFSELSPINC